MKLKDSCIRQRVSIIFMKLLPSYSSWNGLSFFIHHDDRVRTRYLLDSHSVLSQHPTNSTYRVPVKHELHFLYNLKFPFIIWVPELFWSTYLKASNNNCRVFDLVEWVMITTLWDTRTQACSNKVSIRLYSLERYLSYHLWWAPTWLSISNTPGWRG